MNNRIKELRITLDMSQSEFAAKLNLGQTAVSSMERGASAVMDRTISQIVSTFGVSEHWLRTGEGDMFPPLPEEDEDLMDLFGHLTSDDVDPRKKRVLTDIAKCIIEMDSDSLDALHAILSRLSASLNKEKDED